MEFLEEDFQGWLAQQLPDLEQQLGIGQGPTEYTLDAGDLEEITLEEAKRLSGRVFSSVQSVVQAPPVPPPLVPQNLPAKHMALQVFEIEDLGGVLIEEQGPTAYANAAILEQQGEQAFWADAMAQLDQAFEQRTVVESWNAEELIAAGTLTVVEEPEREGFVSGEFEVFLGKSLASSFDFAMESGEFRVADTPVPQVIEPGGLRPLGEGRTVPNYDDIMPDSGQLNYFELQEAAARIRGDGDRVLVMATAGDEHLLDADTMRALDLAFTIDGPEGIVDLTKRPIGFDSSIPPESVADEDEISFDVDMSFDGEIEPTEGYEAFVRQEFERTAPVVPSPPETRPSRPPETRPVGRQPDDADPFASGPTREFPEVAKVRAESGDEDPFGEKPTNEVAPEDLAKVWDRIAHDWDTESQEIDLGSFDEDSRPDILVVGPEEEPVYAKNIFSMDGEDTGEMPTEVQDALRRISYDDPLETDEWARKNGGGLADDEVWTPEQVAAAAERVKQGLPARPVTDEELLDPRRDTREVPKIAIADALEGRPLARNDVAMPDIPGPLGEPGFQITDDSGVSDLFAISQGEVPLGEGASVAYGQAPESLGMTDVLDAPPVDRKGIVARFKAGLKKRRAEARPMPSPDLPVSEPAPVQAERWTSPVMRRIHEARHAIGLVVMAGLAAVALAGGDRAPVKPRAGENPVMAGAINSLSSDVQNNAGKVWKIMEDAAKRPGPAVAGLAPKSLLPLEPEGASPDPDPVPEELAPKLPKSERYQVSELPKKVSSLWGAADHHLKSLKAKGFDTGKLRPYELLCSVIDIEISLMGSGEAAKHPNIRGALEDLKEQFGDDEEGKFVRAAHTMKFMKKIGDISDYPDGVEFPNGEFEFTPAPKEKKKFRSSLKDTELVKSGWGPNQIARAVRTKRANSYAAEQVLFSDLARVAEENGRYSEARNLRKGAKTLAELAEMYRSDRSLGKAIADMHQAGRSYGYDKSFRVGEVDVPGTLEGELEKLRTVIGPLSPGLANLRGN